MSNLAFTTLVVFLFATPGYLARKAYYSGVFTKATFPKNITDDLAFGALISLPFHMLGIGLIEHLHKNGIGPGVNMEIIMRLATGDFGKDSSEFVPISKNLYEFIHHVAAYFIVMSAVAFGAGFWWRDFVWDHEWDLKYSGVFEYKNRWLYTLMGRGMLSKLQSTQVVLTFVDVIVGLNEKTRLYRGIAYQFETDENGQLRDIVLYRAQRGKFESLEDGIDSEVNLLPESTTENKPKKEISSGEKRARFYWEAIPGDFFIIKYQEIKNLNITYHPFSSPQHQGGSAAAEP